MRLIQSHMKHGVQIMFNLMEEGRPAYLFKRVALSRTQYDNRQQISVYMTLPFPTQECYSDQQHWTRTPHSACAWSRCTASNPSLRRLQARTGLEYATMSESGLPLERWWAAARRDAPR